MNQITHAQASELSQFLARQGGRAGAAMEVLRPDGQANVNDDRELWGLYAMAREMACMAKEVADFALRGGARPAWLKC